MLFITISLITFKVKDAWTFFGINNYIVIVKTPSGSTINYNSNTPIFKFQTQEKGKYEFEFIANGYEPLKTYFIVSENSNLDVDILLSRINTNLSDIHLMPDEVLIEGYVSDNSTP
jgi:hypothetical protein